MRIALALLALPLLVLGASLTGTVVDATGAGVARAGMELSSGTRLYQLQTDDNGAYQFSNLTGGQYTLTVRSLGFKVRMIKFMLLEGEQKRIPDIGMDIGGCGLPSRDLILLPSEFSFGSLSGRVTPSTAEVEVTLVCRTFSACRSTKTDSNGRFSFEMLSPGVYGLNFRREGFYPVTATGYSNDVNAGWESDYDPTPLEKCPKGNCDPKLRPKRPPRYCE